MTNIYLARHGQTEYNRCRQIQGRGIDASLNETGKQQANAIAKSLRPVEIDQIFSSSLKRSRETAEIIAKEYGLQVKAYEGLDEMDFGVLEGRPISEIQSELERLHDTWKSGEVTHACEQGESPVSVFERAECQISKLIKEHQQSNLLFILHGRLIRILLSQWLKYGLSSMHRIPHTNGALYHLQWDGSTFESVYINNTEHLTI